MIGEEQSLLLSKTQQDALLKHARTSLQVFLGCDAKEPELGCMPKRGVFVTLRKKGLLRGCIGHAVPHLTLEEAVWGLVRSAARDQRFDPVTQSEEAEISIELSVLTPLQKVDNQSSIRIGQDGLMVQLGFKRGLLLPKVASQRAWDREAFLSATCQKAGLDENAWKETELEIFRFQCQVFSEETSL